MSQLDKPFPLRHSHRLSGLLAAAVVGGIVIMGNQLLHSSYAASGVGEGSTPVDAAYIQSHWHTSDARADLNHDGVVNEIDLSILSNQLSAHTGGD